MAPSLMFCLGPLAGIIGKKYGNHFTAMLGSLLSAIGLASSCFVESIHILYLTHGIITGLGFSFMFNSTNSIINLAFDKRRTLATGIATSGIGFGTICLPLLGSYFLKIYGWRGTFLLLSGITSHGFCSGMIFRLHRRKLAVVKSDGKQKRDKSGSILIS
ncbi:hypothetical protein FSP39_019114 [Pinctada imbricata]|uniref:Major facilitator superfamily (MFS) profile domain-containing protein n=1 Tax=Pinctada imbricata TaxID=66713 RepID=A0AA89C943_PINIB|nr:hypothetical protein FSP39_019114 [Pinctada imbricata]